MQPASELYAQVDKDRKRSTIHVDSNVEIQVVILLLWLKKPERSKTNIMCFHHVDSNVEVQVVILLLW